MDYRYHNAKRWTTLWLAGSGVSYQWAAGRGNGDLDVLFGVDYDMFISSNPDYQWMERHEIVQAVDYDLKANLWPSTAYTGFEFNGFTKYYELTFFLNDYVTADTGSIVNIHPYAAYDLTHDSWTVKPSKHTARIDDVYEQHVTANNVLAGQLAESYETLSRQLSSENISSPRYVNALRQRDLVVYQIRQLFDSIHLGRKAAFTGQGEGYSDFYNYQWQAAKRDGLVNTLNRILNREK